MFSPLCLLLPHVHPAFSLFSVFHTEKQLWNQAAHRRVLKINIAYLLRLSKVYIYLFKKGVFAVEKNLQLL